MIAKQLRQDLLNDIKTPGDTATALARTRNKITGHYRPVKSSSRHKCFIYHAWPKYKIASPRSQ
jgi:hypothetical protein